MMAKPHKHAGLSLQARTKLADSDIAQMAKAAAEGASVKVPQWSTVRVEKAEPGRLAFSVRGPGGLVEQLVFQLTAAPDADATRLTSSILRYKTSQTAVLGFIPIAPKRMLGLQAHRKWLSNLADALRSADPTAQIDINGPVTGTGGMWV
jgi:hypothetical protein